MNEPQVWTMIIGTLAVFFTLVGLISTWFVRLMTTQFEAMSNRFDALEATIDARFAAVEARFETVDVKLTHLDRDVQALTKHVFRHPE